MINQHSTQDAHRFLLHIIPCLLGMALLFALMGPGLGRPPQAHAQGEVVFVTITGSAQPPGFSPALVTVHIYDTVIFLNLSQPAVSYAVVAADSSFSSPAIAPSQQWSATMSSPGAFEYHEVNATPRMVGVIVVVDASTVLLPTPIPAAQATAISDINAGKMPSDTVWQQGVPQQAQAPRNRTPAPVTKPSPWQFWISFGTTAALVIALEVALFGLVKGSIAGARWIRAHRKRDEDDDEDEDEDE